MNKKVKTIMIYRLGSLGDTIIALPAFHMIARAFPNAKRYLIGNMIAHCKASHASTILGGSGLIDEYISYPTGLRSPREFSKLRHVIKTLNPDILIYLAASRGRMKALRDAFFFRWCGIKKIIGVSYTKRLQENQWIEDKQCYEHEAHRLARCIDVLGPVNSDNPHNWDLKLSKDEMQHAWETLGDIGKGIPFISCAPGTKVDVKNWGIANWEKLIERLFCRFKGFALVFVGVKVEYNLCAKVGQFWAGKQLNLCGALAPRESAAVLAKAALFIGHDSGPMHLAAAMGTPCVAIFSARNKPGVWFPYGQNHRVIYHKTECYGCGLEVCKYGIKKCITSITVEEVEEAVKKQLQNLNKSRIPS